MGPSDAVASCPAALWCPNSSAVAAVLACRPQLPSGSLLTSLWQRISHLLMHLFIYFYQLRSSAPLCWPIKFFRKVLRSDCQSYVKLEQTWPIWPERDLQSDYICYIFTDNRAKNSTASSVVIKFSAINLQLSSPVFLPKQGSIIMIPQATWFRPHALMPCEKLWNSTLRRKS